MIQTLINQYRARATWKVRYTLADLAELFLCSRPTMKETLSRYEIPVTVIDRRGTIATTLDGVMQLQKCLREDPELPFAGRARSFLQGFLVGKQPFGLFAYLLLRTGKRLDSSPARCLWWCQCIERDAKKENVELKPAFFDLFLKLYSSWLSQKYTSLFEKAQ